MKYLLSVILICLATSVVAMSQSATPTKPAVKQHKFEYKHQNKNLNKHLNKNQYRKEYRNHNRVKGIR